MNGLKLRNRVEGSWLGRRGIESEYSLDEKPMGLRVTVIEWKDGKTQIKLMKGDGRRKKGFSEYKNVTIPTHSKEEIDKVIEECLEYCRENNLIKEKDLKNIANEKRRRIESEIADIEREIEEAKIDISWSEDKRTVGILEEKIERLNKEKDELLDLLED